MASFYQRTTGRRPLTSEVYIEDITPSPIIKDDTSHQQNWGGASRDGSRTVEAGRVRSRTMNSTMSFYAAGSNSDGSSTPSPPVSPHLTRDKDLLGMGRSENTARTIISKGRRILRKHGSKFSLSSLATDSDTSDRPLTAHTASSRGKDRPNPVHEAVKREELKRTISEPFAFQHHTHTDRVFLNSIQRVPGSQLLGEFSALRAGQASTECVKGFRVEALPAKGPFNENPQTSPVKTSDLDPESNISQKTLRPTPPPKDKVDALSPAHHLRMSHSVDRFSTHMTSSIKSNVTPPRRYSSRRALLPPLGAYVHSPSHSIDGGGADSTDDLCDNCKGIDIVDEKSLPGLPQIHAVTTSDDSARHLLAVPLPRTPMDLAEVPEEDDTKRQSTVEYHLDAQIVTISTSTNEKPAVVSKTTRATVVEEDKPIPLSNRTFVVENWDDAIDDYWEHAAEPEAAETQCPSSMSAEVASFVDKAMVRLAGQEQTEPLPILQTDPVIAEISAPRSPRVSIGPNKLDFSLHQLVSPNRSNSSPLLGLGIELQQRSQDMLDPWSSPNPTTTSTTPEVNNRDSSLTASFKSDFSAASRLSKSSSQESVLWSIASSIIGTQRSSNSSNSLLVLDQSPDCPRTVKSIDDLRNALENVQEHLQEIHEEQLTPDYSSHESHPSGKHSRQRARSLVTDFVFGIDSSGMQKQQPAGSNDESLRGLYGHERQSSGSRISIPLRKSSVATSDQAELSRRPARRMRSATTIARSRQASRASYSLFPGI